MREHLYKAKRKDNGEWVEGFYYEIHIGNETTLYYIHNDDNPCIEIFPETLCEYIGLTDKNGKKIFENDVIRRYKCPKVIGTINYDKEHCQFNVRMKCYGNLNLYDDEWEVIGNIFCRKQYNTRGDKND